MVIEHDRAHSQFVARSEAGAEKPEGVLTYALREDGVLDLQHTLVAASARGYGVGDELVRAALAYARSRDARVVVTCPYVRAWLERHPADGDIVVS